MRNMGYSKYGPYDNSITTPDEEYFIVTEENSMADLLQRKIDKENENHLAKVMIAYFTGERYPGPGFFEVLFTKVIPTLVPLVFVVSNIYIYYFVYHFSFNENFLLIFFFFGFFGMAYNYGYFLVLQGLDSLSLDLYIQYRRLLVMARQQLTILRNNLKDFLTAGDGLFLTYYRFLYTYVLMVSSFRPINDSLYTSFLNSIILKMHAYQFELAKKYINSSELNNSNNPVKPSVAPISGFKGLLVPKPGSSLNVPKKRDYIWDKNPSSVKLESTPMSKFSNRPKIRFGFRRHHRS